ncbi:hypothetical protein SELMODRAFT_439146 [Selaginella moellendorffii]|uniref:Uncharacterized protein n=2 Tax=Selaginella moellendorffii TaxID=88036 RepID=D8R2S7_SELML|nr:hypothetical protein SELMODRAFT_439146 [Selaginella moellendorffii]
MGKGAIGRGRALSEERYWKPEMEMELERAIQVKMEQQQKVEEPELTLVEEQEPKVTLVEEQELTVEKPKRILEELEETVEKPECVHKIDELQVKELEEFEEQQKLQLQLKYLKSLVDVLDDMCVLFYNAENSSEELQTIKACVETTSQGIWALMKHEMKDSEKMAQTADRIINGYKETKDKKILLEEILAQMQRQLKNLEASKLQTVDPRHTTSQLRLKEAIERLTTRNGILSNVKHVKQLQDEYYAITRELRGFYASCRAAKKKRTLCKETDRSDEGKQFSTHAVLEVSLQHHSKLIRLHSTTMNPILPSEVIPLPVHLAETGRISWRPSNKDYLWSEAQPLSKVDVDELSLGVTATVCLLSISAQPRSIPLLRQCGGDGSVGCNICFKVFVRQASSSACYMNCLPCAMDVIVERGAGVNAHTSIPKGDSGFFYEVDVVHDLNKKSYYLSFLPRTVKFERAASRDRGERTERPVDDEMTVFDPGNPSGDGSGARRLSLIVPYCSGLNLSFLDGNVDVHVAEEQSLIHTATGGTVAATEAQGIQPLIATSTGRMLSYLPSCKTITPATQTSPAAADSHCNDSILPLARIYSPTTREVELSCCLCGSTAGIGLADFHLIGLEIPKFMPYRIDNFLKEKLRFYHKKCQKTENVLQPYSSRDYTWDEPCLPIHLVIEAKELLEHSVHTVGQVLSVVDLLLHTTKDLRMLNPRIEETFRDSRKGSSQDCSLKLASSATTLVRHPIGAVHCYQCIYWSIAPLRLQLEERKLTYLLGPFKGLFVGGSATGTEKSVSFNRACERSDTEAHHLCQAEEEGLRVEAYHIDQLELTVSFSSIPWCSCTVPALGDRIVGTGSVSYVAFFQGMVRLHERRREPVTS